MTIEQMLTFGARLGQEQDQWLLAQPLDGVREAVLRATIPAPRRRARSALVAAALVAAAVAVALTVSLGFGKRALEARVGSESLTAGAWIAPSTEGVPLDFSDGSKLIFAPGTRARLGELSSEGAHVVVEAGRVDAAVIHRSRTNYRLSFGPFAVDVTGTKFDVNWDPSEELLTLRLHEGSVLVSGCVLGTGRPVLSGETLRAWCRDRRFEVSAAAQATKPGAALPESSTSAAPAPSGSVAVQRANGAAAAANAPSLSGNVPAEPSNDWRALARAAQYEQAFAAIGADRFAAECERASLTELGLLADVARFSKRPQAAIQAYITLRQRFPGGARSGQAAFAIARLHFDQLGQYDGAAQWFRTYLSEQPRGPLAREALGRLMESEQRSGQKAAASKTARQYLEQYPTGPHARVAERLSGAR